MKCSECDFVCVFGRPNTLYGKLITCIQWVCPYCKTENKEYFPLIKEEKDKK
jgi:hypothetical protein